MPALGITFHDKYRLTFLLPLKERKRKYFVQIAFSFKEILHKVYNKMMNESESFLLWSVESKLELFWFFFFLSLSFKNNFYINWIKTLHQLVTQLVSCILSCLEPVKDRDGWKLSLCSLMLHDGDMGGFWTLQHRNKLMFVASPQEESMKHCHHNTYFSTIFL